MCWQAEREQKESKTDTTHHHKSILNLCKTLDSVHYFPSNF